MRLNGKTAIITGGGGEIGRATALRFSEEDAQIVVADINEKDGLETVDLVEKKNGEAIFIKTDMTQEKNVEYLVEQTLDHIGKLDILYNNAGVNSDEKKIAYITIAECQKVIEINLAATFLVTKLTMLCMNPISSIFATAIIGEIKCQKLVSPYSATKWSVITLTMTAESV